MPVPPTRGPRPLTEPSDPGILAFRTTARRIRRACGHILIVCLALLARSDESGAGDWPQILGPTRNGVAIGEAAPERLAAHPKILWHVTAGQGYAGPAIVGSTVILFHRLGDAERVQAIDGKTGQTRWQRDFDANYRGGIDADTGPRCVPLIASTSDNAQKIVLAYGAGGVLHALRFDDGQPLWSRDLVADFGGSDGYFGAGSSPIVVDDRVLINAGGRRGGGLVALGLETGKTIWQATDDAASYSSPTLVTRPGGTRVLFITRMNALLIDPQRGTVVASHAFGRSGPTVNAATPLVFGDFAFLTASYRVGATLLQIEGDTWKEIWANDDSLSSQYNTPIYSEGYLYGIHGREDLGPADLRCIEAETGRVAWSEAGFGVAHLLRLEHRLLILKVDGTLVLADVNPRRFQELGRTRVSQATTRALPAVSDGKLFIRENLATGGRLICLEL